MATYSELIGKRVESFSNDPSTTVTYTVTVASSDGQNRYFIDGVQQKQLRLYEGVTYNFDYSAASSHPFRFSTTSDGTHGGGSEYTTGVTVDSNITTIVVATGAPNLFYYCSSHSGMGGRANTPAQDTVQAQMWYNKSTNLFKTVPLLSAWSSSSSLNTARIQLSGAISSPNTASLAFGGYTGTESNSTEEYNGSGWATGGNLSTSRYQGAGAGTQTAGLFFGGRPPASGATTTEEYGGASWTSGGALPVAKMGLSGCGLQTAALAFGGSPPTRNTTEEYDGSSWTAGGTLSVAFEDAAGAGTQTAGLKFGGRGAPTQTTEKYDGSSWTTSNNMNTGRGYLGGAGIQTAALGYGGMTLPNTYQSATESYNGTTWTTSPATMGTAIRQFGGTGATNTAALAFGGESAGTATLGTTEEFNSGANLITFAAWSSGGNLGTARYGGGFGMTVDTAGIAGNDQGGGASAKTELYDGTSFTESGDLTQVGYRRALTGTQTAGLAVGAYAAPSIRNWVEEFNGSSWTATPGFPSITQFGSAAGPQTAAFYGGQYSSSTEDYNEWYDYDGSSWTASTPSSSDKGQQRGLLGNAAAQTAAVACGGYDPANEGTNITESWNGSAWSTVNSVPTDGWGWGYGGTQTAGLIICNAPGTNTNAISWDGTNWITAPSLSTSRASIQGGAGTSTSAIQMGGNVPPGSYRDSSEEFSPGSTALNVRTLTQS